MEKTKHKGVIERNQMEKELKGHVFLGMSSRDLEMVKSLKGDVMEETVRDQNFTTNVLSIEFSYLVMNFRVAIVLGSHCCLGKDSEMLRREDEAEKDETERSERRFMQETFVSRPAYTECVIGVLKQKKNCMIVEVMTRDCMSIGASRKMQSEEGLLCSREVRQDRLDGSSSQSISKEDVLVRIHSEDPRDLTMGKTQEGEFSIGLLLSEVNSSDILWVGRYSQIGRSFKYLDISIVSETKKEYDELTLNRFSEKNESKKGENSGLSIFTSTAAISFKETFSACTAKAKTEYFLSSIFVVIWSLLKKKRKISQEKALWADRVIFLVASLRAVFQKFKWSSNIVRFPAEDAVSRRGKEVKARVSDFMNEINAECSQCECKEDAGQWACRRKMLILKHEVFGDVMTLPPKDLRGREKAIADVQFPDLAFIRNSDLEIHKEKSQCRQISEDNLRMIDRFNREASRSDTEHL